ncbi:MAG: FmdB family zinc ribbon protein [Planctomycetota bacterium]
MPTYDYVCTKCGHAFEAFQSMSEALLKICPSCKRRSLKRLIGTGAGIIFKGSGFYETDYKRAGEKQPSETKPGGNKDPDSKHSGNKESSAKDKPAASKESPSSKESTGSKESASSKEPAPKSAERKKGKPSSSS